MTRSATWNLPQIEPEFRKDVTVGTEDVIVDRADSEKRNVNLTIILNIKGNPHVVTDRISVRHLKLTADNKAGVSQLPPAPAPASSSKSSSSKLETNSSEPVPEIVLNGTSVLSLANLIQMTQRSKRLRRPS